MAGQKLWQRFFQRSEEIDNAGRRRLKPYRDGILTWGQSWWQESVRLDDAVHARLHPGRQRLRQAYAQWLKRHPRWDVTAGRFWVIGTLLWAHVRTIGNFLAHQWPDSLKLHWPPRQAFDWLGTSMLLGLLVAGANVTSGHVPTVPAPARAWEVIGYYENDQGGIYGSSLPTMTEQRDLIDTISPFWYVVDDRGEVIATRHDADAMRQARTAGQRVIPLVINALPGEGRAGQFIKTAEERKNTADNLLALVEAQGYDGLNIYFPWLGTAAREPLSAFAQLMAEELGGRGRLLGVSVYPRQEAPEALQGAFDYAALAEVADYIVLMAYDLHWERTAPGPTAPLDWVEKNVRSALDDIPSDRLVLGVGLFGYDWAGPDIPTQYLPTHAAESRAERLGISIDRDQESGQPFYRYTVAGIAHEVWFEDSSSTAQKLALVEEHGLRGIALWRLGFEQPDLWNIMKQHLGAR